MSKKNLIVGQSGSALLQSLTAVSTVLCPKGYDIPNKFNIFTVW